MHVLVVFFIFFIYGVLMTLSAISWRPVLVVEEAGVHGETTDHGHATGKHYHLRLRVECTHFDIYNAGREPTPYW